MQGILNPDTGVKASVEQALQRKVKSVQKCWEKGWLPGDVKKKKKNVFAWRRKQNKGTLNLYIALDKMAI